MTADSGDYYAKRIAAVLRYIGDNLDADLSLERLSEVAGFSRFHFHRQFRLYAGVNPTKLITLLRLKRASLQLAIESERKVIDIALEAGFGSPEAFARAFRRTHGQSPSEFRREPDWEGWVETFRLNAQPVTETPMQVEIVDVPPTRVAVLEHCGPPESLMRSVSTFITWRKSCAVSPEASSKTLGVPYSDPESGDPAEFRFDICGETRVDVPPNPQGVISKEIPGGRRAVTRHVGSTDRIAETVRRLYAEWLPQSGERLGTFPCYFHYVARMPRVSELEQVTDVYLPLAAPEPPA